MIQIEPYALWLGNAGSCRNLAALHHVGVQAVVQLAIEEPPETPAREMLSVRIPLHDGAGNDAPRLRLAVGTVASLIAMGTPTLVCCSGGMSRSPSIAACALARVENCDPATCLERIAKMVHADVSPALWRDLLASI